MAAPERRGRDRLLKSSSLGMKGEEEMRTWRHGVDSPQDDGSSSWLLIHQTHPCGPRLTLHPTVTNTPCHTPQLDLHMERVCVTERGRNASRACGLCHGVCHLLSHNTLGIVCACVCRGKEGCFLGDPSVTMLCYYLSNG